MARLLLLHVIFHGILFSGTWTWSVTMPGSIKGLYGSCLVIPCSYSYRLYPPKNPYRVVWYQYVSHGYPSVYDSWQPGSVIGKFRGKTSLKENRLPTDCSLLIKDLDQSHHGEKLYAWIDPENVGRSTYRFFDVTSTIYIETSAKAPSIDIYGGNRIGETITVQCSTYHTCPDRNPTLTLSGIEGRDGRPEHTDIGSGIWKITLKRTGIVKSDKYRVDCVVRHPGGLSASATRILTATCPIYTPQITPDSSTEFLEGVETDIVCSVMYKCPGDRPYITWNGGQLPGSMSFVPGAQQEARSTLKFTARATDHGKVFTCRVEFKGSVQTERITLKVKRSMFSRDWTFSIPNAIRGVRGSCVVIPCSFDFKSSKPSNVNVKWYEFSETQYPLVYDQSTQKVIPKFRGKTSLYGSPYEGNCSLKIQHLELQHNQERLYPWMDPKAIETYHRENYLEVTIVLEVTDIIEKPKVDIIGSEQVGEPITLSCSVMHTCPPTPPTLSFSISHGTERLLHTPLNEGKWKITKEITWNLQEDDVSVTCTVSYPSGQTAVTEVRFYPSCESHTVYCCCWKNTLYLQNDNLTGKGKTYITFKVLLRSPK
uniref:Si:dkey-238d18.10 n=1 Tax=Pygocentrus nattereri TaxID=42514 RepID=A0AAR2IW31_PYGNA